MAQPPPRSFSSKNSTRSRRGLARRSRKTTSKYRFLRAIGSSKTVGFSILRVRSISVRAARVAVAVRATWAWYVVTLVVGICLTHPSGVGNQGTDLTEATERSSEIPRVYHVGLRRRAEVYRQESHLVHRKKSDLALVSRKQSPEGLVLQALLRKSADWNGRGRRNGSPASQRGASSEASWNRDLG